MNVFTRTFSKIFKSANQQELDITKNLILAINSKENSIKSLSDGEFKEKTQELYGWINKSGEQINCKGAYIILRQTVVRSDQELVVMIVKIASRSCKEGKARRIPEKVRSAFQKFKIIVNEV